MACKYGWGKKWSIVTGSSCKLLSFKTVHISWPFLSQARISEVHYWWICKPHCFNEPLAVFGIISFWQNTLSLFKFTIQFSSFLKKPILSLRDTFPFFSSCYLIEDCALWQTTCDSWTSSVYASTPSRWSPPSSLRAAITPGMPPAHSRPGNVAASLFSQTSFRVISPCLIYLHIGIIQHLGYCKAS